MNKILVTGSSGFIGSQLVNKLVKKNFVVGLDDFSSGGKKRILKDKNFYFIKGSCDNKKNLRKIKGNIDFIYHLAGQSSGENSFYDPLNDLKKNLLSTVTLLDFAIKKKCKRFIFASSMSVYGNRISANEGDKPNPISFYGLSKFCSEEYIKKYLDKKLNYTICRLFNVFGAGQTLDNYSQGMIRIFLTQIKKSNYLKIKGSPNRVRDFIDINNVVSILEQIPYSSKTKNQILNIGSGSSLSVSQIVKILKKNINKNFLVRYVKGTPLDQNKIYSDNRKLKKIFSKKLDFQKHSLVNFIKSLNL